MTASVESIPRRVERSRIGMIVSVVVLLPACTSSDGRVSAIATRDSAGVRIVDIPGDVDLPTWTIDTLPETVIGGRTGDPAHELARVRAAVRLSDGSIAIGDQGASEIRIFDSGGNHLRTFGRQGMGPGEFASLGSMIALGDTLLTYDWQQQRATTFSLTGAVLETTQAPFNRAASVGRLPDGSLVSTSFPGGMPRRPEGTHRDTAFVEVIHPSGARDTISRVIAVEWFSHGDNGIPTVLPFGLRTYVTVAGARINVADSDRLAIREYSPDGTLEQVVRIDRAPPVVTTADWEWAGETYIADFPAAMKTDMEQRWARVTRAEHLPLSRGLVASADGDTWMREFSTSMTESTWWVIDPEGLPVARVVVPMGLGLLQVGRDHVVALRDTDSGPEVSVRRLLK